MHAPSIPLFSCTPHCKNKDGLSVARIRSQSVAGERVFNTDRRKPDSLLLVVAYTKGMKKSRLARGPLVTVPHALLSVLLTFGAAAQNSIQGLHALGPDPALAQKLKLFGQFVGDWECEVVSVGADGKRTKGQAEWHFGWILDGVAIQDVWIARDDVSKANAPISEWGTTVRLYDLKSDVWRVVWAGPRRGSLLAFVARQSGAEIVMEVDYVQDLPRMNPPDGPPIHRGQWIFDDIKPNSFHWRSVISHDGGKTWQLQSEMFVHRVNFSANKEVR
jgi:hypothetical protein